VLVIAVGAGAWWMRDRMSAAPQTDTPAGAVLQTVQSGNLAITLSNDTGALRTGDNRFRIEFRSTRNNRLTDVGDVRLNANMTMPGMAMTGTTSVARGERPGVYEAAGSFAMSGAWDMTLEWNGPAGRGSAAFKGSVQ
jgi:YtkA-like protein